MSGDEVFACVVSIVIALICWGRWYARALMLSRMGAPMLMLALSPPVCGALLFCVLRRWASHDVRDDQTYLGFYLTMGAAWVAMSVQLLPMMAINIREDVVERHNAAAAWTAVGAIAGVTACFAGANVGEGPGWWVVVFSAFLSTAGLFAAWVVVQAITGAADAITIDRDRATGIRLGALLLSVGMILGRGVAGDWVSVPATFNDLLNCSWPVFPLLACEVIVGWVLRPSPQNPVPSGATAGFLPALAYVAWSLIALRILGQPA